MLIDKTITIEEAHRYIHWYRYRIDLHYWEMTFEREGIPFLIHQHPETGKWTIYKHLWHDGQAGRFCCGWIPSKEGVLANGL